MSEYGLSPCNYSMLTEHLAILFRYYILGGRLRAPPEFELHDLIPTFRPEAKTNRRALQSKFKSWARRMEVRNDILVLSSNGKVIISKEKSKDLILSLHSKNHLPVEQVITQIRRTYTWTSKNFGMDREAVTMCIFKHCPNTDCRVQLRKDLTDRTYGRVLFPGVMIPPFTHHMISSTSSSTPPLFFPWVPGPSSLYPCIRQTPMIQAQKLKWMEPQPVVKNHAIQDRAICRNEEVGHVDQDSNMASSRQCKKVRNIHEFKSVLEASFANPTHYPAVLSNPKTQFFGHLGLVPKKVCASSAIYRFRKELIFKRSDHRFNKLKKQRTEMFCRKVLRDRNKIAKTKPFSQENKNRSRRNKKKGKKVTTFLVPAKRIKREETTEQESEKNDKISLRLQKVSPVLIDLASSEDEVPIPKSPKSPPNMNSVLSTKWVSCLTPGTASRPILQRLRADRPPIGVRMLSAPVPGNLRPISSSPRPLVMQPKSIQVPNRNGNFRLILAKQMPDGRYVVVNSQPVAKSVLAHQRPSSVQSPVVDCQTPKTDIIAMEKQEKGVSLEMDRLLGWIRKTKSLIKPSLHKGSEKAMQKLTAHINTGLYLVRDTRKALIKVENSFQDSDVTQIKTEPFPDESRDVFC